MAGACIAEAKVRTNTETEGVLSLNEIRYVVKISEITIVYCQSDRYVCMVEARYFKIQAHSFKRDRCGSGSRQMS